MRPRPLTALGAVVLGALLCAPAPAREGGAMPPEVAARLDEVQAALDAVRRDGSALVAAARALRRLVEADPALAEPIRERLAGMVRGAATGRVAELDALLLPLVLVNALPGGSRVPAMDPTNLLLTAEDGSRTGEAFLVAPGSGPAPVQGFRVEWTDMPGSLPLSVGLCEGVHFTLVSNDCPARPPSSGTCRLAVRFDIAGNGIRQDTLVVRQGPLTRQVPLYGQGQGFPPAEPEVEAPQSTTVRLDAAVRGEGDGRVTFRVVNRGAGALPPFVPRLWSPDRVRTEFWQLDRSSSCTSAATMPGDSCTVVLAFSPTRNGQESAGFALPEPAGADDALKRGMVFGYARGFADGLPPDMLTNGDACPAAGTAAEVVLQRRHVGPSNDEVNGFDTLACEAWGIAPDGGRACADPGTAEGGARRSWRRASATEPWRLVSVRAAEARLSCRSGVIERVGSR